MHYRAEIDGLRAVAVVPVILFHAGFELFSGGYVGVDVFFVISGYLITSIILNEMDEGKFSLVRFYERRARRILPALFFVMLVCLPFAWVWLMPHDLKDFAESLAAVSTFSSNILFWSETGYFNAAAELKPLLHTWSLAVEEQYYILFPLFMMLTWSLGKRWILAIFAVVFVLSFGIGNWSSYNHPAAAFYLLITRGWEILIGAFVAFYLQKRSVEREVNSTTQIASFIGLSFVIYAIFVFDDQTPFPSLYTLAPTVGVAFVIIFAVKGTLVNTLLSNRMLVGIGLISYSAYLWHHPLFAFSKYTSLTEPSAYLILVLCIATFPLAYLSWRFIEKPFRNRKIFSRRFIFSSSSVGAVIFLIIGAVGVSFDGFANRAIVTRMQILDYQPDNSILHKQSWKYLRELSGDKSYGVRRNKYDHLLWFNLEDSREKVLIVGNSHSKDIYNVLINSSVAKGRLQIARYGSQISKINSEFFESPNYINADIIIIASKYREDDFDDIETVINRILSDKKRLVFVKNIFEWDNFVKNNLADYLIQKRISLGDEIDQTIVDEINIKYFEQFRSRARKKTAEYSDRKIEEIKRKFDSVIVLDRMDYICELSAARCFAIDYRLNKYFHDYGHHTWIGAQYFGSRVDTINWLEPLFLTGYYKGSKQ